MADADDKKDDAKAGKKKRLVGIMITLVLIIGSGVGGTIFGSKLFAKAPEETEHEAVAEPESEDAEPNPFTFQPLIVDVKDKKGQSHHLKVGLSLEATKTAKKEEFEKLQPRGRSAAIWYLRGKSFEELTDPAQLEAISRDLNERIVKAMGEKVAHRVLITDFVVQ